MEYSISNQQLNAQTSGLGYRKKKDLNAFDAYAASNLALWGSIVLGVDEGDGWLRVEMDNDVVYLPMTVRGCAVVIPVQRDEAPETLDDGTPEVHVQKAEACSSPELATIGTPKSAENENESAPCAAIMGEVVQDVAIPTAVQRRIGELEVKLSKQIQGVQQQHDRLDGLFSALKDEMLQTKIQHFKTATLSSSQKESHSCIEADSGQGEAADSKEEVASANQPELDGHLLQLGSIVSGFSEQMQAQIGRFDRVEERLGELRSQIDDEVRAKFSEILCVSSAATDDLSEKYEQLLLRVEALKENTPEEAAVLAPRDGTPALAEKLEDISHKLMDQERSLQEIHGKVGSMEGKSGKAADTREVEKFEKRIKHLEAEVARLSSEMEVHLSRTALYPR